MAELLGSARALVVTACEEFGIAAVEALAAGRPVIALGKGGVRESVQEGVTGVFYEREDPDGAGRDRARLRRAGGRSGGVPRRRGALQRRALPDPAGGDRRRGDLRRAAAAARATVRLQAGLLHGARAGGPRAHRRWKARHERAHDLGYPSRRSFQRFDGPYHRADQDSIVSGRIRRFCRWWAPLIDWFAECVTNWLQMR